MKLKPIFSMALVALVFLSCSDDKKESIPEAQEFSYNVEQFADIKILRYKIPGWENLTLKEQKLVYYLCLLYTSPSPRD